MEVFVKRNQELNKSSVQFAAVVYDFGRRALPGLNDRNLDSYLRGRYLSGMQIRTLAEKLAGLDLEDMETLITRARQLEVNFLGFNGFY